MVVKMFLIVKRAITQKLMIRVILKILSIMNRNYLTNLLFKIKQMNICMISNFKRKKES
jgi:hypothetical protein